MKSANVFLLMITSPVALSWRVIVFQQIQESRARAHKFKLWVGYGKDGSL
jgi:hypothetical protein